MLSCPRCGSECSEYDMQPINPRSRRGAMAAWCRSCQREDPEGHRKALRRRGRARKGTAAERLDREEAWERGICDLCRRPFKDRRDMHHDHDHNRCGGKCSGCEDCWRGWVCASCNTAVLRAWDNHADLFGGYLEPHSPLARYLDRSFHRRLR